MSLFAIDLGEENSYSLAALRGGSALIIDKKQLAISRQHSAKTSDTVCDPLPGWDWDWVALG
jgi:hypothetical protein